jgi:hypothetical protein
MKMVAFELERLTKGPKSSILIIWKKENSVCKVVNKTSNDLGTFFHLLMYTNT